MRERGRQVLTTVFTVVTGGIAVSIVAGSLYFLLDPAFSVKRLLIIPLLVFAADLSRRLLVFTGLSGHIGKIGVLMGVPVLISVSANLLNALRINKLAAYGRKLIASILPR
jgi:hypothetical protein